MTVQYRFSELDSQLVIEYIKGTNTPTGRVFRKLVGEAGKRKTIKVWDAVACNPVTFVLEEIR